MQGLESSLYEEVTNDRFPHAHRKTAALGTGMDVYALTVEVFRLTFCLS